jgi:hypothetical protein
MAVLYRCYYTTYRNDTSVAISDATPASVMVALASLVPVPPPGKVIIVGCQQWMVEADTRGV